MRIFGLALMAIDLLVIAGSLVWVAIHRSDSVVIAAQPPFLYVLCMGSTITSLLILFASFDESVATNQELLDNACVAIPWLAAMGHIVTYCALFTKVMENEQELS